MTNKAVFLDRDGTLIEERGYLDRMELLSVFPWTADALRLLKRAGYMLVVVTNQSAIARGIIEEAFLDQVHAELSARLARGGAAIDRYYHCPHLADAPLERYRQACRCRKPGPGMIEQACRDLSVDPARSFMIGDRWLDVACGVAAGTRAIRVRTGHGMHEDETRMDAAAVAGVSRRSDAQRQVAKADVILGNLMEAAGWILRNSPR
jgi:D-glycero-D-manno-heptose 1,7-bisphosphate phosphatase